MTRKLLVVLLVVLAALPAAAFAGTSSAQSSASKQCVTVQAKFGASAFAQVFPSFGACVTALTPLARENATGAASACRAERASAGFTTTHGGKTFARFYGTGPKSKNAFGRCVAAKELSASRTVIAAATVCQTATSQFWGASAFATCVTTKAQPSFTASPAQPTPAPEPQQQGSKGGTVGGGCGPVETGGTPKPLGCLVAKPN